MLKLTKINIVLCLIHFGICGDVTEKETELAKAIREIGELRKSVEVSSKEEWDALQSLRFHLLSARSGIKQALEDIRDLKSSVQHCKGSPSSLVSLPIETIETTTTTTEKPTTVAPLKCEWPAEKVDGRCFLIEAELLLSWQEAMQHCKSNGGVLAGPDAFDSLRNHLTDQFGIDSPTRVRWSFWVAAQQTLSGWQWADPSCRAEAVAASSWAQHQPHRSADVEPHCMALWGYEDYLGKAVPCSALRRFVCDVTGQ